MQRVIASNCSFSIEHASRGNWFFEERSGAAGDCRIQRASIRSEDKCAQTRAIPASQRTILAR
jgi:hypothetical protein